MSRVKSDADSAAFGEIYDRHCGGALRVAYSVCRDRGQAEDAVQEGFLSVWRGRSTFTPEPGASLKGWVMEAVRNRAIDAIRRESAQKRPPRLGGDPVEPPDASRPSALDEVIARGERDALRTSLDRLPPRQAEVIALAFFGGLTHVEIATQLDLPSGTVKGRMRLGLAKLRRDERLAS